VKVSGEKLNSCIEYLSINESSSGKGEWEQAFQAKKTA